MPNWPEAPPSENYVMYLNCHVYCRTTADQQALQAEYGTSILRSPAFMRDALEIDEADFGFQIDDAARVIRFPHPPRCIEYDIVDNHWIKTPILGSVQYPSTRVNGANWWPVSGEEWDWEQDWFIIPAYPADPSLPTPRACTVIWVFDFLSMGGSDNIPAPGDPVPPEMQAITPRVFMEGVELPRGTETGFADSPEGNSGFSEVYCRDASRTPDGIGAAFRGDAFNINRSHILYGTPTNGYKCWQRIYLKFRSLPAATTDIFQFIANSNGNIRVGVTAAGLIRVETRNQSAVLTGGTTSATSPIVLDEWQVFDFLLLAKPRNTAPSACQVSGATQGNQGFIEIYVGRSLFFSANGSLHDGFGVTSQTWEQTLLGPRTAASGFFFDADDWTCRSHPSSAAACVSNAVSDTPDFTRIDWILGSHIQVIPATDLVSQVNWAGDWRIALQLTVPWATLGMVSTTSGARIELNTELDGVPTSPMGLLKQMGICGLLTGHVESSTGARSTAKLGWKKNGVDQLITFTEGTGLRGYSVLATPAAGGTGLINLEPLNVVHTKSTDVVSDTTRLLYLVAEFLGSWGPEDDEVIDAIAIPAQVGIHNAPYIGALGRMQTPPLNSLSFASGTYVGDGVGQDISLPITGVHFLWIRNITANSQSYWFSTVLGAHTGRIGDGIQPGNAVRLVIEDDGTTTLRIAGNLATSNAVGITYQYFALSDIMSRVCLAGAFHNPTTSTTVVNPYFYPQFTAEAGIFLQENLENNGIANGLWFKGPANSVNAANQIGIGAEATAVTFGTGSITSRVGLHNNVAAQCAYILFRQLSESSPCSFQPCVITSYVGNGVSPRTISIPLSGRRPMFAFVWNPASASTGAYMRDASHSAGASTQIAGTTTDATHITGGAVDGIIVGSGFNTNLTTYQMIVFPGFSDVGGNDGWSLNGDSGLCAPGWDPESIPSYFAAVPEPPGDIVILPQGGIVLSGEAPRLLVENMSGIYTLIPGKRNDTLYDRQATQPEVDVKIPDPSGKLGYVGG